MAASITSQPADLTVQAGASATFTVVAAGTAPLAYQWQRKDATAAAFEDVGGATEASYTIAGALVDATGAQFRVRVSNRALPAGVSSRAAALTVTPATAPPAVTAQPQGVAVLAGQGAAFSVSATGTAPLAYQWQRAEQGSAAFADLAGATSSAVAFTTVLADDGARLRVRVSNSVGEVVSGEAALAVTAPPTTTATVGPAGGTLDLTDPDGTAYKLEVPAGALAAGATLSLTAFPPVADQRFRVVVGPPGLVLEPGTAATLTVRLPAGHELAASGGLFSDGHPAPFITNSDGSVALKLRAISKLVASALPPVHPAGGRRMVVPFASVVACGTPTASSQGVTGADTVDLALYAQCMTAAIDELDRTGQFDAALAANLSVAALLQRIGGNGAGDAQSYLDAANATACRARGAAFDLAAGVTIDSMGELSTLLRPMAYWESVVQRLGAPCTVPVFAEAAADLTTKALALYAANRPGVQDTGGALYHSTVAEAREGQTVRREVAALDPAPPVTAAVDAQVKGRAERSLVDELLDGPWTACRNDGDYAPLMAVMDALASPDQAKDLAQYCGTAISVEGFTAANPTATSLGTDGPVGDATRAGRKLSASLRATADGSVKLTGLARSLACPSGDESPEALVFTLNGHEVKRLAGPSYLGNAVNLDVAQLLAVAGLDATALGNSVALTITRDGDACMGYWGTNPTPLLTLNLQSRPDRLVQVEHSDFVVDHVNKVVRVYKIEPTGTTVVFDVAVLETPGIGEIYFLGAAYLRQQNHAVIGIGIQGGFGGSGWGILDASGNLALVHPPVTNENDSPALSLLSSNGKYRAHNFRITSCPDPEGTCNYTYSIRVYENSSNALVDDFWPGVAGHSGIAALAVGPAGEVLFADSSAANQPPLLYVHTSGGGNTLVGAYTPSFGGAFSAKGDKVYLDDSGGLYEFDRATGTPRKLSLPLVNDHWVAEPGGILYMDSTAGVLRRYDLTSEQITTVGSLPQGGQFVP